jgi:diacylglycerol kinase (ATP)
MVIGDIDSNSMYCFKTRKIDFSSMVKIPWTLDGEFGGEHTQVEVENIQKAIEIKRP